MENKQTDISMMLYGRVQPQNLELEEMVIGAMLLEPDSIVKVMGILTEDSFYSEVNGIIFSAMKEMFNSRLPIEITTVPNYLKSKGQLEIVGGAFHISEFTNRVGSSANIEYHAMVVEEQAVKRRLINLCSETIRKCYDDTFDVLETLNEHSQTFTNKVQRLSTSANILPEKRAETTIDRINFALQGHGLTGVPSGLKNLDFVTGGWQNGNLIIVGARPAMGKTAFVVKISHDAGVPVLFFQLEMSDTEMGLREISMFANVEYFKMRTGKIDNQEEYTKVIEAQENVRQSKVYVDTSGKLNMTILRSKCYKMVSQYGIKMVVIDYLNLMQSDSSDKNKTKEQMISDLSADLNVLAKELLIPIILLCQLNREVEKTTDKRPQLHHLKDSGALEQNADVVILLYRPEYYSKEARDIDGNSLVNKIYIDVVKQKQGSVKEIKFGCNIACNQIFDIDEPRVNTFAPLPQVNPDNRIEPNKQESNSNLPF
jgi:replicative DNA helicase